MALELGRLENVIGLDNFMNNEGYEKRSRRYAQVIQCWCGCSTLRPLQSNVFAHYQLCDSCGCLILRHVLPFTGINELYGIRYYREHQSSIGLPSFSERYEADAIDRIPYWINTLKRHYSSGRVLEVGCSHGRFIKELSVHGYDAVGLELDKEICDWARSRTKCDIRHASIDALMGEQFDAVFANDVLEHVYDPKEMIIKVAGILRPGGKAFFQTVVFENWEDCPQGMLRPLFHTVLYSNRSLQFLEDKLISLLYVNPGILGCKNVVFVKACKNA
jgi:SAM-dependent methyltransferase